MAMGRGLAKKSFKRPPQKGAPGSGKSDSPPPPSKNIIPQLLVELEEACKRVDVRLTYEAIGGELGSGGLCKVKGKWRAIIDKRTTPSERVALLLPMLARFPIDEAPLSPPLRELFARVHKSSSEAAPSQSEAAAAAP